MNYEAFREKFDTWDYKFKPFIESSECDAIYAKLKADGGSGKHITPSSSQTYRAFEYCRYESLKCVFIGQDPYCQQVDGINVADGIAFSCSNTGKLQPSLTQFYNALEEDIYSGLNLSMERNPDLSYLARQGVLLLNSSLTTTVGKSDAHKGLWDEFINYTLKFLNEENRGLIFVFIGNNADDFSYLIDDRIHYKFSLEHPSYAARQMRTWKHHNIFSKINDILQKNNNTYICWDDGEAPF